MTRVLWRRADKSPHRAQRVGSGCDVRLEYLSRFGEEQDDSDHILPLAVNRWLGRKPATPSRGQASRVSSHARAEDTAPLRVVDQINGQTTAR